ncbi:MAG TPA: hypothetical protein VMR76_00890 [Candidatus Saccharimonadia bacterium]|nr:hypothetical protein [Candidatus Saccharimonadia bacterium]
MEGLQDDELQDSQQPVGARPEVEGTNSKLPDQNSSTIYAAGGPPPKETGSVERDRTVVSSRLGEIVTYESLSEGPLGGRLAAFPKTISVMDRTDIDASVREIVSGEVSTDSELVSDDQEQRTEEQL